MRLEAFTKAGNHWPAVLKRRLHFRQTQRRFMAGRTVPDLGYPKRVAVGRVIGAVSASDSAHAKLAMEQYSIAILLKAPPCSCTVPGLRAQHR